VVRHGCLDEVTGAVELVHGWEVRPPVVRLDEGVVGVDVAILALSGGDEVNDAVHLGLDGGFSRRLVRIGRALEDLVDVRVIEVDALELALLEPASDGEVAEAPRLLAHADLMRQAHLSVTLHLGSPEFVLEGDLVKGHRRHLGVWRIPGRGRGGQKQNGCRQQKHSPISCEVVEQRTE